MRPIFGSLLFALVVAGPAALGQTQPPRAAPDSPSPAPPTVDPATRVSARRIADEGMRLYDKGECTTAATMLGRAHDLVHVPTLALYAGKCLERVGRLVEASEWYRLAGLDVAEPGSEVQAKAQAEAVTLRAAVQARTPSVVVSLDRPAPDADVLLDAQILPTGALGIERPIDPGHHHAEVRRGPRSTPFDFAVAPGEHRPIVLRVPAAPMAPEGARTLPAAAAPPSPGPWVVGGIGVASLIVGAATGALVLHDKSVNDAGCNPATLKCTLAGQQAGDAGRTLGAVTTTALVVGVAGVAGGSLWLGLGPVRSRSAVGLGLVPGGGRLEASW